MLALLASANDINTALNVGFGIIAAMMIFFALNVVSTRNVVHAALSLVMVMAGAAGANVDRVAAARGFGQRLAPAHVV